NESVKVQSAVPCDVRPLRAGARECSVVMVNVAPDGDRLMTPPRGRFGKP
ncbi:uncharacterized, partial [Tachysurus ichikawai]